MKLFGKRGGAGQEASEAPTQGEQLASPEPARKKSGLKLPEMGPFGAIIGLAVAIAAGVAVVLFGGHSETDFRLLGPAIPGIAGACCSAGGVIAYGIAGVIASVLLWGVLLLR
jgi:hypothetical protein